MKLVNICRLRDFKCFFFYVPRYDLIEHIEKAGRCENLGDI